ncbi:MAG: MaoC/PaaZ C-terminal domain-containing protein [Chthoniobacterales bacterium]
MVPRTFADFAAKDRLVSGPQKITKKEIIAFARAYDPQAAHLKTQSKGDTLLGGIAASGWQTAAISMRLFVETMNVDGAMIGVAVDGLRWPKPVRPGDALRVEIKILTTRHSQKRPEFGLIRYRCITRNQENEIVQRYLATAILPVARGKTPKRSRKTGQ